MQKKIKAVYMRGGTSKGVFFHPEWLPAEAAERDRILLRVIGSPDPYGQHIDGMGAATSSTSKVVLVAPSSRDDIDVDYTFGQVSLDKPVIDWSGNCGNLTAAVGPFAISQGMVDVPRDGMATVRIWQENIGAKIVVHVPLKDGMVVETGDFFLDGVAFPAAEIAVEFLQPLTDENGGHAMFPTGNALDTIEVPGVGSVEVTMMIAGNPAVFVDAATLNLMGNELQRDINDNATLLSKAEAIRSYAAVRMGLSATAEDATALRPHTPKLAFVARPRGYVASNGRHVDPATLDLNARIFSMGKLHHAMTGTGAVAIAAAAAIPGTLVSRLLSEPKSDIRFGHPSGSLACGAAAQEHQGRWIVTTVTMSRSARRLMEGAVFVPDDTYG